ncbi:hypothetical protein SESBI_15602 [Sesbania bispinosa]|nr:hypothetical protein SESBI_15602 [Sesbania bispinosa]
MLVTEELKAKAEVYYGDQICREKFSLLLAEIGLPDGLLTMDDIEECGYIKEIGFVWLKLQKRKSTGKETKAEEGAKERSGGG